MSNPRQRRSAIRATAASNYRAVLLPLAAIVMAAGMLCGCVVEEPGYHHGWGWGWHHHDRD